MCHLPHLCQAWGSHLYQVPGSFRKLRPWEKEGIPLLTTLFLSAILRLTISHTRASKWMGDNWTRTSWIIKERKVSWEKVNNYGTEEQSKLKRSGMFSILLSNIEIYVSAYWDKKVTGSLVVQWLGIHLAVQRTPVQSLVWEDPTRCRATKPVCHKDGDHALEPSSLYSWSLHTYSLCIHNKGSHHNGKTVPAIREQPPLTEARESPCAEKTHHSQKINRWIHLKKTQLLIR